MMDWTDPEWVAAFVQVVIIDLTLAGDNAIVIGLAASGLPAKQRGRAIVIGILGATLMRIGFALVTTQLLKIVGLLLAGGILLLWVAWKMWRELHPPKAHEPAGAKDTAGDPSPAPARQKTLGQAVTQIMIADVSMSLDNVLAVAGAAHEHPVVLVFGLALSIALMGVAATAIAKLLQRQRWIAYVGLVIIFFVAAKMIWEGAEQVREVPAVERALEQAIPDLPGDPPED